MKGVQKMVKDIRQKEDQLKAKKREYDRQRRQKAALARKGEKEKADMKEFMDCPPRKIAKAVVNKLECQNRGTLGGADDFGSKLIPLPKGSSAENASRDVIVYNLYVHSCQELKILHDVGRKPVAESLTLVANRLNLSETAVRNALDRVRQRVIRRGDAFADLHDKRGPKGWLTKLPADIYETIRTTIHSDLWRNGIPLTMSLLHHRIKSDESIDFPYGRSVLHAIVRSIGFRVRRGPDGRKYYYKSKATIKMRATYLQQIFRFRMEGRQIIFIDESWIDSTDFRGVEWHDLKLVVKELIAPGKPFVAGCQQPKGTFKRLMLIGAHGEQGWLEDSGVVWSVDEKVPAADPHKNMTSSKFLAFLEFLLNLPGVEQDCVVVLDNAAYHKEYELCIPTKKADLIDFINQHGGDAGKEFTKKNPKATVAGHGGLKDQAMRIRNAKGFKSVNLAKNHAKNATLLFLPPYTPVLNPIESAWSVLKRLIYNTRGAVKRNTKEMQAFVQNCMKKLESEDYVTKMANCYAHTLTVEQKFKTDDGLVDMANVEPLVIPVDRNMADSESESDSEDDDEDYDDYDGPEDGNNY